MFLSYIFSKDVPVSMIFDRNFFSYPLYSIQVDNHS